MSGHFSTPRVLPIRQSSFDASERELPVQRARSRFGVYDVVQKIGAGGMASVYEARHRALGKAVAIKSLHPTFASDAEVVARFVREGRAASRIRHPNVVDIYDVGVEEGHPFLVMELLFGETLRELLDRRKSLDPHEALSLVLPVAAALEAAHREGIVHRDVKPENIFVTRPSVGPAGAKLLDFGIAKVRDDAQTLTGRSAVFGTPYYMSPEQTRGTNAVDARSDQYSLAAVLYECLTGRPPFSAPNVMALLVAIQQKPLVAPRSIATDLAAAIDAVVMRALERDSTARFPTMSAFGSALVASAAEGLPSPWREVFASDESSATRPVAAHSELRRATGRSTMTDTSNHPTVRRIPKTASSHCVIMGPRGIAVLSQDEGPDDTAARVRLHGMPSSRSRSRDASRRVRSRAPLHTAKRDGVRLRRVRPALTVLLLLAATAMVMWLAFGQSIRRAIGVREREKLPIESEEGVMKNKVALVTGASSGIGAATAARLAAGGYAVYGTSRRGAPA